MLGLFNPFLFIFKTLYNAYLLFFVILAKKIEYIKTFIIYTNNKGGKVQGSCKLK